MPEERGLYKKMKIGEHALYLAQLKGLSRSDAMRQVKIWFERLEMQSWWNKKVEDLSKGMGQKLQFVATVLHDPKLIILDEPFSGLDPVNSNLIKDEIFNCPPVLLIVGRPEDNWLASWSRAEDVVIHPIDPFTFANRVAALLRTKALANR